MTYYDSSNIDFRNQLREFAQAIVWEPINENTFIIKTDKPNVQVSWQVTGIRNDIYAQDHRIIPEVTKPKSEQGKLLYERPPFESFGVRPKNKILTTYPY